MIDASDAYRRKVRWQMRRGLLELDIVLSRFLNDDSGFDALSEEELHTLEGILKMPDQEFLRAVAGVCEVENPFQAALIDKIRLSNQP